MKNKQFVSGDEAIALGVKLAKPHVIAAYPITPQTITVERLADYVEDGSLNSEYIFVESEHSALSACLGASAMGSRTFTATSSQGLLYMCEVLHYVSGSRLPIVMMNANRSTAAPWNIYGDQRDSLSQLDTGWIQFYAENAQEALDTVIQAYRIAEDKEIMTPVMINIDGFILTHTYELVQLPEQSKVDEFIPYMNYPNKMDLDNPRSTCVTVGPAFNAEFRYQQQCAIIKSAEIIRVVDKEYEAIFGRSYGGLVENYYCDDADAVLVTLGSVTGTARLVVDNLRSKGMKVGLLKLRCIRPFPKEEVAEILKNVKTVGVLEKDISFGYEGAVFSEINSALIQNEKVPKTYNFIAGLGGRNISKGDIYGIFEKLTKNDSNAGHTTNVEFVNLGV